MEQSMKEKRMKRPLAVQFRHTFIQIVVVSVFASIVTIMLSSILTFLSLNKDIYPADYYEDQIPGIVSYVQKENVSLLEGSGQKGLAAMIKGNGIWYQVTDQDGNVVYGTLAEQPYTSKEDLFTNLLDKKVLRNGYYIESVPIEQEQEIRGAVILAYKIKPTFANMKGKILFAFFICSLLSPFLYLILFTLLFSRKFAGEINRPLELLSMASQKIKEKDLVFSINYHEDNELGRLCEAFTEMQEELKESLTSQWEMEQERIEMTAALAHDLKSPLSLILAYSDALLEDYQEKDGELKNYLMVIHENAEKSADFVRQMQYTAELEKKDKGADTERINLEKYLSQRIQSYHLQAQKKSIELSFCISDGVPDQIIVDEEALTRILDNLLSNSLEHTPAGGRIEVNVSTDKEKIYYTVMDTGSGFDAKDLKNAFHKFYRGDESRDTSGGHAGLGLYIVKKLAEQMGGTVQISNTSEGGACVCFCHKLIRM